MRLPSVQGKTAATALGLIVVIVVVVVLVGSDTTPSPVSDSASGPQPLATASTSTSTPITSTTATTDTSPATAPITGDSIPATSIPATPIPDSAITPAPPPPPRPELSQPSGARGLLIVASAPGAQPGEQYSLYFADSASLATGACHDVGVEVGGPTLSGNDGTIASTTARVPTNASRGAAQVCFAVAANRAIHSDAASFLVF